MGNAVSFVYYELQTMRKKISSLPDFQHGEEYFGIRYWGGSADMLCVGGFDMSG